MDSFAKQVPRLVGEVFALVCRGAPGYEAHLWPDGALVLTGEPEVWFNAAAIDDGPRAEVRLRDASRAFGERGVPGLVFVAAGAAARLAPVAREAGLQDGGSYPWMVYRPAGALPAVASDSAYHVARVTDEAGLREANQIATRCFGIGPTAIERVWGPDLLGMLGFNLFLARRDGEAVSTVMTTEGGSVVGIWTMATLPERQRQGAGRALLAHVLTEHTARGATLFYLGATEEGRPLYERAGFRAVTETAIWVAGGTVTH